MIKYTKNDKYGFWSKALTVNLSLGSRIGIVFPFRMMIGNSGSSITAHHIVFDSALGGLGKFKFFEHHKLGNVLFPIDDFRAVVALNAMVFGNVFF
jgi:hypothetical protein